MPELPDIQVYLERLEAVVGGRQLERVVLASPFVVRSVEPAIGALEGRVVRTFQRSGKRLVLGFDRQLYLVIHLMISGRLRFKAKGTVLHKKRGLAAFEFEHGCLQLTEASTQKRASIHVVRGATALEVFDRGGLEPLSATLAQFKKRMVLENRTLKRALTDPRLMSGIGNAYSDEILHAARLSPVKRTRSLTDEELKRLHASIKRVLRYWTQLLRKQAGEDFPDKVTAFHDEMAVHGKYGTPCPDCGTGVQRIRYASNEVNYCPMCQTDGKLLADRGLSRLLKSDWPRTMEELEELKQK